MLVEIRFQPKLGLGFLHGASAETNEFTKGKSFEMNLVPSSLAGLLSAGPEQTGGGIGGNDPSDPAVYGLLEPEVPPRGGTDLVEEKHPRTLWIHPDRLCFDHFAGGDLANDPLVREIEVRQILRRPASLEEIVDELQQQHRLPYLPRAQKEHGATIVKTLDSGENLRLKVSAKRIFSDPTDLSIPPPRILALQQVGENHPNAPRSTV